MFVNVRYYKPEIGGYAGRDYAYETALALEVGDQVIAPTKNEPRNRAIVTEVFVPAPVFPCRQITEYDPEGAVITGD